MGIVNYQLRDIKNTLEQINRPCKILSLGYPTFHPTPRDVARLYGQPFIKKLSYDQDNKIDSYSFFRALGHELISIDFIRRTGTEIHVDLNYPIEQKYFAQFDFIIDPGTIEHCFNIAQVMENLINFVKVGGYIYHCVPMLMINHGYYNFSPRFFKEYYELNGFEIIKLKGLNWDVKNGYTEISEIHPTARCVVPRVKAKEAVVASISRKINHPTKIQYPVFKPRNKK